MEDLTQITFILITLPIVIVQMLIFHVLVVLSLSSTVTTSVKIFFT